MRIFAGFRWTNESVSSEMAILASFTRYLPNIHIESHNYYIVLCSRLEAFH